ncbi:MAG: glycosyltransferase family 39 protein [Kiritimatiellae bacterium]|nr:glycosyltransferase family 39 protein [Kiritimatiellia bacterium]
MKADEGVIPSHAKKTVWVLSAASLLVAGVLYGLVYGMFPGLALSADRPPIFWETLRIQVIFFAYLSANFAIVALFLRRMPGKSVSAKPLSILALFLALAIRWATPEMALDLSPAPDALHYASLASRLVSSGDWTIPIGPHLLPSRFSPGTSLLLTLIQWIRPDHLGTGIAIIWLSGALAVMLIWRIGSRIFSPRVGVVAALLLASSPAYGHYSRLIMSEIPWSLFILMALSCIYLARGRRVILWLGGFLLGLGMLFKPPHAAVMFGAGAGYLAYMYVHPNRRWHNALWLAAGVFAGLVPWLLYNRFVLGGWLLSGYEVYDSNQCAVDAIFSFRYLIAPPIEKGFTGNLIYYPMAALGLEPRMSRMLFAAPVSLLVAIGLWLRRRRSLPADPVSDEGQWLLWGFAGAALPYVLMFMFLHWQDSRYVLPVLPLICLGLAVGIDPFVARLSVTIRCTLLVCLILVLAAMGSAILQVEREGRRPSSHETWHRLASIRTNYDVLATDEDPLILGFYHIWNPGQQVVPVRPPGSDWPGDHPEDLRRRTGIYMTPCGELHQALLPHLSAGRSIAVWLHSPRSHRPLLDSLPPEYALRPWKADLPHGYELTYRTPTPEFRKRGHDE